MKKSVTKKVFIDLDVYKDFVRLAKSNKIPAETYLGLLIVNIRKQEHRCVAD